MLLIELVSVYGSLPRGKLLERLASNAAIYGASLIVTRLGWLFLLPIYWSRLGPSDYGIIGVCQVLMGLLGPLLGLGIHDALQRFYHEWHVDERPRNIATLWICVLLFSAVICVSLELLLPIFAPLLFRQIPFDPYLRIAIWTAFFVNLIQFVLAILRITDRLRQYSLITVGLFATQSVMTIYLVLVVNRGTEGYLIGIAMAAALWAMYATWLVWREAKLSFNLGHVTGPLRYALPIVPGSILDGLCPIVDRYFLDKNVSLAKLGLYNLGNQFGSAFNIFNIALKTAWYPFLFRLAVEREDTPEIAGRFAVYYLAVLTLPALGVALLSEEIIYWFGAERFLGVYPFVPFFVLTYYIQSIGSAMGRGLDMAMKTAYTILAPLVQIVILVISMAYLVPRYDVWGVVAGVLIAMTVRVLVQVVLCQHFYPRPLYWARLLGIWGLALAAFVLGCQVDIANLLLSAVAKSLIILTAWICIILVVPGGRVALRIGVETIMNKVSTDGRG